MNTSHLTWIEHLILEEKDLLYDDRLTGELLDYHQSKLNQLTNKVKREILTKFEKLTDESKDIKPAIGLLQNKLVYYQNLLYEQNESYWSAGNEIVPRILAEQINDKLTEIQNFLEEHFPDSFNRHAKISRIDFCLLQIKINARTRQLLETHEKLSDESIFKLCISPLKHLSKQKTVSYLRKQYLEEYSNDIMEIPLSSNRSEQVGYLRAAILKNNLNSAKSFQHLATEVSSAMKSQATIDQKIYYLFDRLRYFNSISPSKNIIYDAKAKPIIQQLIDWIIDEIKYLKKELDFKKDMQLLIGDTPESRPVKLKTRLSVGEISLLARLFAETNLIEMDQVVDIIRWLSASVTSKNMTDISEKSLRKKFYDPDLSSRTKVETHLKKLSHHLKKIP